MTLTSLPLHTTPAAAVAEPVSSPSSAAAPADFVLTLAGLAGTAAPQANAALLASTSMSSDTQAEQELQPVDPEDLLALFALVQPAPQPRGVIESAVSLDSLQERASAAAADVHLLGEAVQIEQANADGPLSALDSLHIQAPPAELQAQRSAATGSEPLYRPVQAPVGSAMWADEIGSRLTMMVEQGRQTASLRLSPEHLGPLEINITIQDDRASVWFGAAHADTRAAIEHALPRLRELFESQGLSLADAGVFREPPREQPAASAAMLSGGEPADEPAPDLNTRIRLGLIDAYA